MNINQHVVQRERGWAVVGEGNGRDTSVHRTQQEAIERARQIAMSRRSVVVVHETDRKVSKKDY